MSTPAGDPDLGSAVSATPGAWSAVLPPTAYGEQLLLVVGAACAYRPELWSADEHQLLARLRAVPGAVRQVIGRLAQRRSGHMPRALLAGGDERLVTELSDCAWCIVDPDVISLAGGAAALVTAAVLVVFGDDRQDLSFFPRVAMGRLQLPAGSRCAMQLQALLSGIVPAAARGAAPEALASRDGLDAYLAARTARAQRLQPLGRAVTASMSRALAEITARAGASWPLLGAHLGAARHWSAVLWAARACLAVDDPRRRQALRALRRAPLSPRAAGRLWEEVWRAAQARSARMISAHVASFALWTPGERSRWRERARQPGQARAPRSRWRVLTVRAWLERDGQGLVVAQGEGVEAHALRRLRQEGWEGLHAEGELWSALATTLFWDEIMMKVEGVWVAPLQHWPLDWRRWGFAHRRRNALSHAAARLIRAPAAALARAYAQLGEARIAGWFTPPPRAASEAIVRLMPGAALVRLLMRVLADPRAASGLPDLITWRGAELVLWEVKSPNDALHDRQIAWLGWLSSEGIAAGELRIDERLPTQASLFAPEAVASRPRSAPRAPRTRPARPHLEASAVRAVAGADWSFSLAAAARLPECMHHTGAGQLGAQPLVRIDQWNGALGAGAVQGWDRPVTAVVGVPALAVLVVRTRRRVVVGRRWYPLPTGTMLAALLAPEALPGGGIGLCARLLERRSGFLVPAADAAWEPVCAPAQELLSGDGASRAGWVAAPDAEPLRPERLAAAWGCWPDLAAQLALLGSHAYRLAPGTQPGTITVAVAEDAPVLWTMNDPGLMRGVLEKGLASHPS